jgi:hypothetical protein
MQLYTPAGINVTGKRFFDSAGDGDTPFASGAIIVGKPQGPYVTTGPPPNSTMMIVTIATMQDPYDVDRPDIVDCQMDLVARTTRNLTVQTGHNISYQKHR